MVCCVGWVHSLQLLVVEQHGVVGLAWAQLLEQRACEFHSLMHSALCCVAGCSADVYQQEVVSLSCNMLAALTAMHQGAVVTIHDVYTVCAATWNRVRAIAGTFIRLLA